MSAHAHTLDEIPGTTIFDGAQAMKGYALNKMCYSFNKAENRDEFRRDEEAFMTKYGLNEQQKAAIRARNVLALLELMLDESGELALDWDDQIIAGACIVRDGEIVNEAARALVAGAA